MWNVHLYTKLYFFEFFYKKGYKFRLSFHFMVSAKQTVSYQNKDITYRIYSTQNI